MILGFIYEQYNKLFSSRKAGPKLEKMVFENNRPEMCCRDNS